jgi:60 kDa SS-A/Ro ribonucleoprotein
MKLNANQRVPVYTHAGAPATKVNGIQLLRRLTMACLLWEDNFYVDGKSIADNIKDACENVKPEKIVELARETFQKGLLRHIPLFLIVQALKKKAACKELIYDICTRPDQMTELLTLYWKDGKVPLSAQLKKGLAKALTRFDTYQLAKYNRDAPIKLRDVLFLCHAKPKDEQQAKDWKDLVGNSLPIPETWETKLCAGDDKKETFKELLFKGKMGKLAILRNLRNMYESGLEKDQVEFQLCKSDRPLLPFQFIAAAKAVPQWEDIIEKAMLKSVCKKRMLKGVTLLLVDVSGSMDVLLSQKSSLYRADAASGLSILAREVCETIEVFTFSEGLCILPPRHGFALRDAIKNSQAHSSTYLGKALQYIKANLKIKLDRIIVITDEQAHDTPPFMGIDKCYMVNVGSYENGIKNNGEWLTITGFSENVIDYILEIESEVINDD